MIDGHIHILPELDDGAKSLEDSLNMAMIAVESGVEAVIATSHGNYYSYTVEEYWKQFYRLEQALQRYGIPLELYSGMELFVDDALCQRLEKGEVLSINEGDTILVEFDMEEEPSYVYEKIKELQEAGWRVILAHPERYRWIQNDLDFAYELYLADCAMQLNFGSLLGKFGEREKKTANLLLKAHLIQLIGTDAHSSDWRNPSMKGLRTYLNREISGEYMNLLLNQNPIRLLKNKEMYALQARRIW